MKLNLGSGERRLPGWTNVDLERADECVDLGAFPWPWADESADEILASHVLEHFTKDDGRKFLHECNRVLRPGGVLYLAVPDMDKFIDCHLSGDFSPLNGYEWRDMNYCMGGYGEREPNPAQRHRYLYSRESLAFRLMTYGFVASLREPDEFDSAQYAAISLYMMGRKP